MEDKFAIMHVSVSENGYIRLQGSCYQRGDHVIVDGHGQSYAKVPLDWCFIEDEEGTLIIHVSMPSPKDG